jgi:protein MpaA
LNRNFPAANWQAEPVSYRWHVDGDETVPIGTGSAPASEPETVALIGLIDRLKPEAVIAVHAPLACIDDADGSPLGHWLAERSGLPLVSGIGYSTPGSMGTWAAEKGLLWITWEFPRLSIEELSRDQAPVLSEILSGAADHLI